MQKVVGFAGLLDTPCRTWLQLFSKHQAPPFVCLLAPPRSGSTLTYQLLSASLENIHLTNISNFLYTLPATGTLLSRWLCSKHVCTFRSEHGFVDGLCGEAEGYAFWNYWAGQGLHEMPERLRPDRLQCLARILASATGENRAIISGYLGHVFCINQLRESFSPIIFVHLKRDLLSNAHSLYRMSPDRWSSITPANFLDFQGSSRHAQVVEQVISIHNTIRQHSLSEDTITIDYEDVCRQPNDVIRRICQFAQHRGINLYAVQLNQLPDNFSHSRRWPSDDPDCQAIDSYIQSRLAKMNSDDRKFFASTYP